MDKHEPAASGRVPNQIPAGQELKEIERTHKPWLSGQVVRANVQVQGWRAVWWLCWSERRLVERGQYER